MQCSMRSTPSSSPPLTQQSLCLYIPLMASRAPASAVPCILCSSIDGMHAGIGESVFVIVTQVPTVVQPCVCVHVRAFAAGQWTRLLCTCNPSALTSCHALAFCAISPLWIRASSVSHMLLAFRKKRSSGTQPGMSQCLVRRAQAPQPPYTACNPNLTNSVSSHIPLPVLLQLPTQQLKATRGPTSCCWQTHSSTHRRCRARTPTTWLRLETMEGPSEQSCAGSIALALFVLAAAAQVAVELAGVGRSARRRHPTAP